MSKKAATTLDERSNNYLNKIKAKYTENYTFDKVVYIDSKSSVVITCIKHGDFEVNAKCFLDGKSGCHKCPKKNGHSNTLTQDDAINKAILIKGDTVDYSETVFVGINKRSTFICVKHGIKYIQKFCDHLKNFNGCFECKKDLILDRINIKPLLSISHPYIYNQIDINNLDPTIIIANIRCGSSHILPWICPINNKHTWNSPVKRRTAQFKTANGDVVNYNDNCPYCVGQKVNETNSLETMRPDLSKEWDFEKNNGINPADVSIGSAVLADWICPTCKNLYKMKIKSRTKLGYNCPYCSGKILSDLNRLSVLFPHLVSEWHPTNNINPASNYSYGSSFAAWWLCLNCKYEWRCEIYHRTCKTPHGCPKCSNKFYSKISIEWLTFVMLNENIDIQHAKNGGEFIIPTTNYRADGYCSKTNTVYEFNGSFYHGNPIKFKPEDVFRSFEKNGKKIIITHGENYQKTLEKETKIKELGYNLVVMWESDYLKIQTKCREFILNYDDDLYDDDSDYEDYFDQPHMKNRDINKTIKPSEELDLSDDSDYNSDDDPNTTDFI